MPAPTISVAMATYNGALYLRDQLDSIARQSSLPEELVIGDDCSTDNTVAIIEDFAKTAPFPVRLTVNPKNLGYGENFLNTAARCLSDWVAFCDQDDIWLEHKLALVRQAIGELAPSDLVLIVHQVDVVDEELKPLGTQLPWAPTKTITSRCGHECFWLVVGIAQVVRRGVFHDFDWSQRPHREYEKSIPLAHDFWISVIANAIGSTRFIAKSCVLYRRHTANLTSLPDFTRKSVLERMNQTFKDNADGFQSRGAFAGVIQAYLETISETAPSIYRARLREHALDYGIYSEIMARRRCIWRSQRISERAKCFLLNIRCGAYYHKNIFGFNLRSGLKDLARVFGFI